MGSIWLVPGGSTVEVDVHVLERVFSFSFTESLDMAQVACAGRNETATSAAPVVFAGSHGFAAPCLDAVGNRCHGCPPLVGGAGLSLLYAAAVKSRDVV